MESLRLSSNSQSIPYAGHDLALPRRIFLMSTASRTLLSLLFLMTTAAFTPILAQEHIAIDAHASATPFPHFWEQMFGSGHANLALRANYRDDLAAVHQVTGFRYVRA